VSLLETLMMGTAEMWSYEQVQQNVEEEVK
jgi:hypothetical protein